MKAIIYSEEPNNPIIELEALVFRNGVSSFFAEKLYFNENETLIYLPMPEYYEEGTAEYEEHKTIGQVSDNRVLAIVKMLPEDVEKIRAAKVNWTTNWSMDICEFKRISQEIHESTRIRDLSTNEKLPEIWESTEIGEE